jgi:hypothetical protein
MTTIIVQLPPGLAREFARIADTESMPHEDLARVALRLFVKAVKADERTNQPTNQPTQDAGRAERWGIPKHEQLRSPLARGSAAIRSANVRDSAVDVLSVVEHLGARGIFEHRCLCASAW